MQQYLKLISNNSSIKTLSSVQFLVYFGAWFSNVAIFTLLLDLGANAHTIAVVAMLQFLSGVIQAPFSGVVIDKFKPKKLLLILIAIEFFSTISLLAINTLADLFLLYTLVVIKMAAASFYFTTEMSLLPKILSKEDLKTANELHSIIWSASYTLGMTIGGFAVFYFGIKMAFVLDAFMFVVAFLLLLRLNALVEQAVIKESFFAMMRSTIRYVRSNKKILHLMLLHAFVGFTVYDSLIALMVDSFYAGVIATSLAIGLLNAARAIGLVFGSSILSKFANETTLHYIFIAQGVAIYIWAMMIENFYLSLSASVLVGLFTTTLWSYTYTMLQNNTDPAFYGRIVAYNDMLFLLAASFASYIVGVLVAFGMSIKVVMLLFGSLFVIAGIYFVWVVKEFSIKGDRCDL